MPVMQESHRDPDTDRIGTAMLAWYGREARALPWRGPPGERQEPYKVWLSEIMLQQTTVKAVTPRYIDFLRRWPTVEALAAAEVGDVLAAWAGLGYYARARNVHACARAVVEEHGGAFPETEAALRKLPGIGAYTAAAIAAIAFGKHATPVDGNIERVAARLFAIKTPLPEAKPRIKALAERLTPETRAGDFAQSMMDLGATICTPRRPACGLCPVRPDCRGFAEGIAEELPYKKTKGERPTRYGAAFVVLREDGTVLLRERPPKGLLGGMLETPSTSWEEIALGREDVLAHAPIEAVWEPVPGTVSHTFTHFDLELAVYRAEVDDKAEPKEAAEPARCRWVAFRALPDVALPSVMRKVIGHAFKVDRPTTRASRAPQRANRR